MQKTVQALGNRVFEKLQQGTQEFAAVVQFVGGDGRFATLSDGYYMDKFAVIKSERRIFSLAAKFDVLQVTLRSYRGVYVLLNWNIVRSGLVSLIGKPITATQEGNQEQKLTDFKYYSKSLDLKIPEAQAEIPEDEEIMLLEQELIDQGLLEQSHSLDEVSNYTQISQLKYSSRAWTVIARVESVLPLKTYKSALEQEKELFNCIVFDESGKVQMTFFDQACQKYKDKLLEGRVYKFRGGDVKGTSQYSLVDCKVSINFGREAEVTPIPENTNVPMSFTENLVSIASLEHCRDRDIVSVMGLVDSISSFDEKFKLIRIRLYDESKTSIDAKFWNSRSPSYLIDIQQKLSLNSMVAFLNMRIKIQGGSRTLESLDSTKVLTELPGKLEKVSQVEMLRRSSSNGEKIGIKCLTLWQQNSYPLRTVAQIREATKEMLDNDLEQKLLFECHVYIGQFMSHSVYYDACPREQCLKKVSENQDGKIECINCGTFVSGVIPKAKYRGVLELVDHTGSLEAVFTREEAGKCFLGEEADKVRLMKIQEEVSYENWLRKRQFRYFIVGLYPKINEFNGKKILQFQVSYANEFTDSPDRIKQTNSKLLSALQIVRGDLLKKIETNAASKLKTRIAKPVEKAVMNHPLGTGHSTQLSQVDSQRFHVNHRQQAPIKSRHSQQDMSGEIYSEEVSRCQYSFSQYQAKSHLGANPQPLQPFPSRFDNTRQTGEQRSTPKQANHWQDLFD